MDIIFKINKDIRIIVITVTSVIRVILGTSMFAYS